MDSSQNASFIPKSPVRGTVNRRRVRKVYIFTYLIYVFFVGTLIATGATWFYKYTVEKKLEQTKSALNDERAHFSQSDLAKVNDVNDRLKEVRRILDRQVSLAAVFKAIEDTTLRSVTLSGFDYQKDENSELTLALTARANDFNATLFQRQVLSTNPVLAQAKISEITYSSGADKGSVSFTLQQAITPGMVVNRALPTNTVPFTAPPVSTTSNDFNVMSDSDVINSDTNPTPAATE